MQDHTHSPAASGTLVLTPGFGGSVAEVFKHMQENKKEKSRLEDCMRSNIIDQNLGSAAQQRTFPQHTSTES